jgi:NADPH:quinone reductase-like Zn-dependent oxidoreductase
MTANDKIKAVIVDPSAPGNVRVQEVPAPSPLPGEALVRVAATSLNRGELRMAAAGPAGRRIGWDFAGTVERAAASGAGPAAGARVVGMLGTGAWAELIAAPVESIAVIPEGVSFAQAATLPVAGLTALYGLDKADGLLGRRVLLTGGTGGVGNMAIQLAHLGGAHVVATAGTEAQAELLRRNGAHQVILGRGADAAQGVGAHGPFDLVLDGVGGPVLGAALQHLAKGGLCVVYGTTADPEVTFNARAFYSTGGARLHGFILFHELLQKPASQGLTRLLALVQRGRLRPLVEVEAPLSRIGEFAQQLIDRRYTGKAVLTF